jgi:RNA polymerase sigma-70 factor (ECF subfamily)
MFGMAFYYLKNADEAQDVTQEIFIHIYKGLGKFRGGVNEFQAWMLSIARNCCLDRIRRIKRRGLLQDEIELHALPHAEQSGGPEVELHNEQTRQLLFRALDQFSDQNREIIILKDIQGLKLEDIAKLLAQPLGTVKSRVSRARVELARIISKLDPDYAQTSERSG